VSGILSGRGFNIDSLVVCRREIRDLSRTCTVISGQEAVVEEARRQLEELVSNEPVHHSTNLTFVKVPVWAVLDYTDDTNNLPRVVRRQDVDSRPGVQR